MSVISTLRSAISIVSFSVCQAMFAPQPDTS